MMPHNNTTHSRWFSRVSFAAALAIASPFEFAGAQWSAVYQQSQLAAPHNGALRQRHGAADRLISALDASRLHIYEALWGRARTNVARLDETLSRELIGDVIARPPRFALEAEASGQAFRKLVPEIEAVFGWTRMFQRQVYDVLADETMLVTDKDGRITELLGYYRSRPELALSGRPKNLGQLNTGSSALMFRRAFPRTNGVLWNAQWFEAGLFEPLVRAQSSAERTRLVEQTIGRFRQMLENPPATAPYLMPISAAVAPEFARRYPEAAAIVDNLHMLQDQIADILVAREVPRSAKRQEMLRAAGSFRSDTTAAMAYTEWANFGETIGANNMGGVAVGFSAALPQPTVARGMSLASQADSARGMAGMDHANMQRAASPADTGLRAVYDRMMADQVIRERVATDPVLQQMLARIGAGSPGANMPGMRMPGMPPNADAMAGMQHGTSASATMTPGTTMPGPTAEERRQANEFVARLLADPAVEARIQGSPELLRLWNDPDVQRRIQELRRANPLRPTPPTGTNRPPSQ